MFVCERRQSGAVGRQVTEVRKDVHMIHHEIDQLQSAKDEMLDMRDSVARLEQQQRRRKARSIDQVRPDCCAGQLHL